MPRLKVRGNCPKCGASREEMALAGRVTWRGPCSKKGCDGTLILRKFHTPESVGESNADNESNDPTPPTTRRGTPRKVPKVGYNKPEGNNSESGSGSKPPDVSESGDGTADDVAPVVPPVGSPADAGSGRKRKREYPYGGLFKW